MHPPGGRAEQQSRQRDLASSGVELDAISRAGAQRRNPRRQGFGVDEAGVEAGRQRRAVQLPASHNALRNALCNALCCVPCNALCNALCIALCNAVCSVKLPADEDELCGCSLGYIRLQPRPHAVTASITYACSPDRVRLQPRSHIAYGCRLDHISRTAAASITYRVQPLSPTVAASHLPMKTSLLRRASSSAQGVVKPPSKVMWTAWQTKRGAACAMESTPAPTKVARVSSSHSKQSPQ